MASQVQKTSGEESKASKIKDETSSSQNRNNSENKKQKEESDENKKNIVEYRETYLGQNIDILG